MLSNILCAMAAYLAICRLSGCNGCICDYGRHAGWHSEAGEVARGAVSGMVGCSAAMLSNMLVCLSGGKNSLQKNG